jgi:Mrp family chromosome partitioning ATPase
MADVPTFSAERIKSLVPVRDAPGTISAESFLFVSTAIDLLGNTARDPAQGAAGDRRIVAVVSSVLGDGKTVVATNTALAAARGGRRVLLVDCNFEDEGIAEMLFQPSEMPVRGLSDIVEESVHHDLNWTVVTSATEQLDFMGRGSREVDGQTLFQTYEVGAYFEWTRSSYDVVLLDVPPIAQASWAGAILRHADAALVVVRHGSDVAAATELRERLDFLGVPILGYVYNMAPFRSEMWGWRMERDRRKERLGADVSAPVGPATPP